MNNLGLLTLIVIPIFGKTSSLANNWYPKYHFAPEKGWMNDPNGLIFYQDYYHVFYQHNPNDVKWGLMHWGHARSKDMLNWEHMPIALKPSLPEDIGGVFSGSAANNNGTLTLMYTGVSGDSAHQVQCLATSNDGLVFDKKGVVLKKEGVDQDFRDPKIWWQNGSWFVVVGSKSSENRGEVLLYKSLNLETWKYEGVLAKADEKLGFMWECPDFFTLGEKQLLIISPQGIVPDSYDYQNIHQTGYFVGTWSPDDEYKVEQRFKIIDHGHNFYASQTFEASDGRRILIAWMSMRESPPEGTYGWAGMLTLPRELTLSDSGNLIMRPIREVKQQRKETLTSTKPITIEENSSYKLSENISTNEVYVEFDEHTNKTSIFGVKLVTGNSSEGVMVYVNRTEGRIFLDRNYSQFGIPHSNSSVAINVDKPVNLDIFFDRSSIEVFVNDGEAVLSSRIYPSGQNVLSAFTLNGMAIINEYTIWDM